MWRLSKNWIIEGKVKSNGFDFHWFKLCLIVVVMVWVTQLCHVYSSLSCFLFTLVFLSFFLPKVVQCMSVAFVIRDDWISTLH